MAAFAPWHEFHEQALAQLDDAPQLPAQSAFEVYSVLTRLPPPLRAAPDLVVDYLVAQFPQPYLVLASEDVRVLLVQLRRLGISGGATYDAVVAATARAGGATLVSCDHRAAITYDRLGVAYQLIC